MGCSHPEGMPAIWSVRGPIPKLASLQDANPFCPNRTGGIALLNPRLIAVIPSG